jgi:ornithine cyclodeaminase
VNAVGACFAGSRELDAEAVARARLYTDRHESCMAEAGDFLIARAEGAVTDAHLVGEVGEVFVGRVPGRTRPDEITLFESLGLAVEDLASAHVLLELARKDGVGQWLDWGGPAGD